MTYLLTIGISILTTLASLFGVQHSDALLGSTITTINGSDTLSNSRTTINNNFSALNTGKIEVGSTSIAAITTLGSLGTVNTSLTGFLKATAGVLSTAAISLTTNVSGTLPIVNGGTNSTSYSNSTLLAFNGTSFVSSTTPTAANFIATSSTSNSTFAGKVGIATTTPLWQFSVATGTIANIEYVAPTSSSMTINWLYGSQQLLQAGSSGITLSFTGYAVGQTLRLVKCNPTNTTAGSITWPTTVRWAGGVAPTQTTSANKCDIYSFIDTQATSTTLKADTILGAASSNF